MYKISVPVINSMVAKIGPDVFLKELKRLDADRVFLFVNAADPDSENARKDFAEVKTNAAYFHAHGLEVGSWCITLGMNAKGPFAMMTDPTGRVSTSRVCPSDETYRETFGRYVEGLGQTGVDLIMFDDDFRYGFQDMGCGCTCPNHLKMIETELGRKVDRETLVRSIWGGGENPVRGAFLHANGSAMEEFAKTLRTHLDRVSPDTRMGFCSCITNWDIDGTHPDRIARLLAGKTKPFYRLIGAPYWGSMKNWGCRLADVIELERMEKSWNEDPEIEIFAEGDVYPRPRFRIPAAYLEGFDTGLRAAGVLDGILKYGVDYTANPGYETGYQLRHERNRALYREIANVFDGKTSVGVRVYEAPAKFAKFNVPECAEGSCASQDIFFGYAARMMTENAIPTTYEGTGICGIVFGANAHFLPDDALRHGLILDAEAAEILTKKGLDVGVEFFGERVKASAELFPDYGKIDLGGAEVRRLKVSEKAEILSRFEVAGETIPGSFRYENAGGQKFLVLCFNAYALNGYFAQDGLYRQYTRAREIIETAQRFGTALPATCQGQPDLYLQTKKDRHGNMSVGLWNFSEDDLPDGVVEVDGSYRVVKTIGCTAKISGNKISLSRVEPFGFAGLKLEKIRL